MVLLRGLGLTLGVIVVLLAAGGYVQLPDSIEDRYRAMLFLGIYQLGAVSPFKVLSWFGYGTIYDYLTSIQKVTQTDLSNSPTTASYGVLDVRRTTIDGVPVIIYRPKDVASGPLLSGLIYIHGGGWVSQSAGIYDATVHDIANCSQRITISVDYRLAPRHPYPAALEDNLAVTKYVLKNGKDLHIDVNRVGIGGDSAGGNLAAAVALQLKEEGSKLPPLTYQALLYPALQAIDLTLPSYIEDPTPLPSRHAMTGFWAMYLGLDPARATEYINQMMSNKHVSPELRGKVSNFITTKKLSGDIYKNRPQPLDSSYNASLFAHIQDHLASPLLSPLIAPDLKGLSPALLVIAQHDTLRDDGLLYAARLREAGVKTTVYVGQGYHADMFKLFPEFLHSKTGRKSLKALCDFLDTQP